MPFENLAADTQRALTKLAAAVSTVQPIATKTFAFRTGDLVLRQEPVELVRRVGDWAGSKGRFVYFVETDAVDGAIEALYLAVSHARETNSDGRKYARLQKPNHVLYVGSSQGLKMRFREHLGYASKSVFALQLAHWANVHDAPVRFTAARYAQTVSDEILGALEDQLWSQLKPMLGRQGRK